VIPAIVSAGRDLRIDVDPEVARRNKARRDRRFNVVVLPSLRLAGLLLLALLVTIYGWVMPGSVSWQGAAAFLVVVLAYSLGSWAVLRRWYVPGAKPDLAVVFLTLDLVVINCAVYVTGGPSSWLFVIVLARAADQGHTTFRRTVHFAHVSVLFYALMLAWVDVVEHREMDWRVESIKLASLYLLGLYMTLAARTAERIRRRTSAVVGLATTLLQRLEEQSAQLRESTRRAEDASRAKSEFLARMSHELRTPLNAIIGLGSVLQDSGLSDDQRDSVATVQASATHLLGLISDILDFSRIEAGRLSIERVPLDLRQVIDQAGRQLRASAAAKGLDFSLVVEERVPARLLGDPLRLAQIVLNLGSNAVKFTERGAVEVRVSAEAATPTTTHVLLEVRDTGIGIPEAARGHLFESFMQADDSTTRRYGGTGLGLSICHRLVQLMGGRLDFDSVVGRGSTFRVRLPLAHDQAVRVPAPEPSPPEAPRAALRVLVAEDNLVNQKVASKLLRKLGCEVTVVADGQAACEAARDGAFTLVLMDCQMPVMDGFEATARIRACEDAGRRLPIVALTANATTEDRDRCLSSGMDDYLAKPVTVDDLRTVLQRWAA
jgi:signal transduction histidine kinase/CheY-like chemotaxis protein